MTGYENFKRIEQHGRADNVYLIFSLAGEQYGIEILKVKEIIGMMPITPVPLAPGSVKGVINLRGKVIPVVDLRQRFALPEAAATERTCTVVVEIRSGSTVLPMGVIVDSVSVVLRIKESDIEVPQSFTGRFKTEYILGIAKMDGDIKILLDIGKILALQDSTAAEKAA